MGWTQRIPGDGTLLASTEEGKMRGRGIEVLLPASRGQQWDVVRSLIRELEEERDLQGLAAMAEMGLMALRQMCERPTTCGELDQLLEGLRRLQLDEWEMGEEQ